MRRLGGLAILIAAALVPAPSIGATPAEARGAIVVVVVKGTNTRLGNQPEANQGTGFFISKDGFLVTAYHVWGDLLKKGTEQGTMSVEVTFDPDSPKTVLARIIYANQAADVMVLYAPVGGRNVPTLRAADRTTARVTEASTPIYSAGYPDGIGFSVSRGYIKSFDGPRSAIPAWTTDITFKGGESGSPILLDDNRVIAMATSVDADATSIGLIVPSRLVPRDYWDGTATETQVAQSPGRILVEARSTPQAAETRTKEVTLANDNCQGAASQGQRIAASLGWSIDPATVKIETVRSVGVVRDVGVATSSPEGVRLEAHLVNVGQCINALGTIQKTDLPASVTARVTYTEIPTSAPADWAPVRDINLAKAVLAPIPDAAVGDLRFTYVTPEGVAIPFTPARGDLKRTRLGVQLDTGRLTTRFFNDQTIANNPKVRDEPVS